MTDNLTDRYDIENLPISDKTREGLTPENINQLGAVGRMLSLQDDFIENILTGIQITIEKIEKRLDAIEARLDKIENNLDAQDTRLVLVEKHIAWPNTFLRIGFGVLIGIGIAITLMVIIHPYLK